MTRGELLRRIAVVVDEHEWSRLHGGTRGEQIAEELEPLLVEYAAAPVPTSVVRRAAAESAASRLSGWWRRRREMRRIKRRWDQHRHAGLRVLSQGRERTGYGSDVR